MSNSLKAQLLKSGLADAKRAKKVHQQQLEAGKNAKDETKEAVQKAMEKAERDRLLNLQRKEEQEKKAIVAQIKQLIETNKIDRKGADTAYQFTDDKKIKKLYVSALLLNQLAKGQIAVVRFAEAYELVPAPVAAKIAMRDAALVVVLNQAQAKTNTQTPEEEDPYANYQIPDDLMW